MSDPVVKLVSAKSLTNGTIIEDQATDFYHVIWAVGDGGSAVAARNATGIPTYCQEHPEDDTMFVKQIQARAITDDQGRDAWVVQVDYTDLIVPDPLSLPDEISWDFSESSEKYFYDNNPAGTKPVVNSAGETFESLPEREAGSITVNVQRNVPTSFSPGAFLSFRQKINDGGITVDGVSLSERQAKFSGCNLGPIVNTNTTTGIVYYRVAKFVLKLKQDWNDVFADTGYHDLDGSGNLQDIVVGTPPTKIDKPYPLNGSGTRQASPTTAPAQLTFWPYTKTDFSSLAFA